MKEASQLGSRCPGNPNRPQTSRGDCRPVNIKANIPSSNGIQGRTRYSPERIKSAKRIHLGKSPINSTEKCSRAIKRRPKSSKHFLVKKNLKKSSTKYRSDFFPEHKVSFILKILM